MERQRLAQEEIKRLEAEVPEWEREYLQKIEDEQQARQDQELRDKAEAERQREEDFQKLFENMEQFKLTEERETGDEEGKDAADQQIHFLASIYRTHEWRLKVKSDNLVQNFFEFTDTLGEGRKLLIQARNEKTSDSAGRTNKIAIGDWNHTFERTPDELAKQPEPFNFQFSDCKHKAELGFDMEACQLTLKVEGIPYSKISSGPEKRDGIMRAKDYHFYKRPIMKSVFEMINLMREGKEEPEILPFEVSYDERMKKGTLSTKIGTKTIKNSSAGGRALREAFPITMVDPRLGWKIQATYLEQAEGKANFGLFVQDKNFYEYDYLEMST